jgi:hypothetical protein
MGRPKGSRKKYRSLGDKVEALHAEVERMKAEAVKTRQQVVAVIDPPGLRSSAAR